VPLVPDPTTTGGGAGAEATSAGTMFLRSAMTDDERREVQRIIEAHETTVAVCRACAETTRDLAWEIRRGAAPDAEALAQTIAEAERVLTDLGQVERAIAQMKASLW
jgi:NMD protein affecting ribosome stability and mRNA decay